MGLRFQTLRARCDGCGAPFFVDPAPMLVDSLWNRIAELDDKLCDRCVMRRLGRPYNMHWDLINCLWNIEWADGPLPKMGPNWKGPRTWRAWFKWLWTPFPDE